MSQPQTDADIPLRKRILGMGVPEKIRLALTGDKEARALLVREPNRLILTYLVQNPRITDDEILAIAKEKTMPTEILQMIVRKKDVMKLYPVRLAVAQNPRTPLVAALRLLGTLRDTDLRKMGRSKDVSVYLSGAARKLLMKRGLL